MLTLPEFEIVHPKNFQEAAVFLEKPETLPMAGGTDLVPNMKHGLFSPRVLVDLKGIKEGREIEITDDSIRLGALCTIDTLANHSKLQSILPALSSACHQIAGPQLRKMGTLGGNICLDTRCVYYNQTYFWRNSLGFCLKKDGTACHVVAGGQKCVAAASNDTAPVLIALDAELSLISSKGERTLSLSKFYHSDGIKNTKLRPGELVRSICIPRPSTQTKMSYQKLRTRKAIDFPLLSLALVGELDTEGRFSRIKAVLNALAARPKEVRGLQDIAFGKKLSIELQETMAAQVFRQAHPLTNILSDTDWRRDMAPVLFERALQEAFSS